MWGASAVQAAPFVDVTYDLGDSTAITTVTAISTSAEIPPQGTISGRQTIRYTGGSGTYTGVPGSVPTLAAGPAELLTFNLYVHATLGYSVYTTGGVYKTFRTLNTSDLHFSFLELTATAGTGQRLAGGTINPYGASGIFRVTGQLHCMLVCRAPRHPQSLRVNIVTETFTAPLPHLTGAVGYSQDVYGTAEGVNFAVEPATITGTKPPIRIGVTGRTFLVGREVQRTAVPEPGTLPLAALGGGMLALAAAVVRRRAVSASCRGA